MSEIKNMESILKVAEEKVNLKSKELAETSSQIEDLKEKYMKSSLQYAIHNETLRKRNQLFSNLAGILIILVSTFIISSILMIIDFRLMIGFVVVVLILCAFINNKCDENRKIEEIDRNKFFDNYKNHMEKYGLTIKMRR